MWGYFFLTPQCTQTSIYLPQQMRPTSYVDFQRFAVNIFMFFIKRILTQSDTGTLVGTRGSATSIITTNYSGEWKIRWSWYVKSNLVLVSFIVLLVRLGLHFVDLVIWTDASSLILPAATLGAVAYGYMWWKVIAVTKLCQYCVFSCRN